MPEMVLFIASKVAGGTSFWIRLTSNGSISCINSERSDFLSVERGSRLKPNPSKEESEVDEARIRVLICLEFEIIVARRGLENGIDRERDGGV